VDQLGLAQWRQCFNVNVEGVFTCIKHCLPLMRLAKPSSSASLETGGSIVNISSSGGGVAGYPYRLPYATSKAALEGLKMTLAMELAKEGVRVNNICPGGISGPRCDLVMKMTAEASGVDVAAVQATWEAQNMLRRFGNPEDIASMASFLLSDDASFVTNQTISVDGGTTTLDNFEDYEPLRKI
jgi:NAD(P)-dependent dehydrogenase (short-subunit alcohol dehydrogenase family)